MTKMNKNHKNGVLWDYSGSVYDQDRIRMVYCGNPTIHHS